MLIGFKVPGPSMTEPRNRVTSCFSASQPCAGGGCISEPEQFSHGRGWRDSGGCWRDGDEPHRGLRLNTSSFFAHRVRFTKMLYTGACFPHSKWERPGLPCRADAKVGEVRGQPQGLSADAELKLTMKSMFFNFQ